MNALTPSALFALVPAVAPLQAQEADSAARALFVANCASCHGETGDGKGWTELDRPARSFQDGGFSFGNTPEALFRTISVGIAGTPMPGFDSSLSEDERRALAEFVVTLGPPIEEVALEDMILSVHERPVIVRGLLPALAEGLPRHPRGLLIGDPTGITFEYRVDDVRLLALRQGDFVRRTDWTGRGGTALEPLGQVVHLLSGGKPPVTFALAGGAIPLEARLSGTRVGETARIDYHLVSEGREIAHVEETPGVVTRPYGTGFSRRFHVVAGASGAHLALFDPTQGPGEQLYDAGIQDTLGGVHDLSVRQHPDGTIECHRLSPSPSPGQPSSRLDGRFIVDLEPNEETTIELITIPLGEWNETVREQIGL